MGIEFGAEQEDVFKVDAALREEKVLNSFASPMSEQPQCFIVNDGILKQVLP